MTAVNCNHSTDFAEFRPAGISKSNFEGSKTNSNSNIFFEVQIFELRLTSLLPVTTFYVVICCFFVVLLLQTVMKNTDKYDALKSEIESRVAAESEAR